VLKIQRSSKKIDLNTASADEIAKALSGVGPAKAQAMVIFRNEVGPFRSLDEVLEIKGFGPSILAPNKSRILLGKVAKKQK
jgi:competence protein ComEA